MQCSPYLRTLNPCLLCRRGVCSFHSSLANPFGDVLRYLDAPAVVGCDGRKCVWEQLSVFRQEMECNAGLCVDDVTHLKWR